MTQGRDVTRDLPDYRLGWEPGHFYSPIPSLGEVRRRDAALYGPPPRLLPGIELNEDVQLALFTALARHYPDQPFGAEARTNLRYRFVNDYFSYGEGLVFHTLLRHVRPRRLIEIGSGFSSALALDTSELFLDHSVEMIFVDPHAERLHSLLKPSDRGVEIIESPVQDIDPRLFDRLVAGDILFIDSSHVSKVGSDVNYLFLEILPRLRDGVLIHIHDIYYPFEYPREWVFQGRAWNEAYLVRAFLQCNARFSILLFNAFLATFHQPILATHMPLSLLSPGSSLWLVKGTETDWILRGRN